jgi:hypothetical protein
VREFLGGIDVPAGIRQTVDVAGRPGGGGNARATIGRLSERTDDSPVAAARRPG